MEYSFLCVRLCYNETKMTDQDEWLTSTLFVCLLVTLLFLDSQETSAQLYIPLDWLGY